MWKVTVFNGWHIKGNVDTFYMHTVNLIRAYVCIARDKIRIDVARASATLLRDDDSMRLLPELLQRRDRIERNLAGVFQSSEIIEELRNINTLYHWDIIDGEWERNSHDANVCNSDDTIADMHVRRAVWVWRRHKGGHHVPHRPSTFTASNRRRPTGGPWVPPLIDGGQREDPGYRL